MKNLKYKAWDGETMYYFTIEEIENGSIGVLDTSPVADNGSYGKLSDMHIMSFTGQQDKNGKDLYEGDIVRVNTQIDISNMADFLFTGQEWVDQEIVCQVVWNNELACFDLDTIEDDLHLSSWGFYSGDIENEITLIGNCFEMAQKDER